MWALKSERKLTVVRKSLLFLYPTENDESIHNRNNTRERHGKRKDTVERHESLKKVKR